MNERLGVFAAILRSPALRRVEIAFLVFSISEWATWLSIVVYAYDRGGAAEAAIIAFVQLVPAILLAPVAASLGDRYPRSVVLVATYGVQAAALAAVAVALAVDAPSVVVYVCATLVATAVTTTRPVQASLLPEVVAGPDELTAANVVSGAVEGIGSLVGPLAAGVLVGLGGPLLVFVFMAAGMALAFLAVLPFATARAAGLPAAARSSVEGGSGERAVFLPTVARELVGGLRAIGADRQLTAVVILVGGSMFLLGALDIFYAVLAFDLLDLGDSGVGFLGAMTGIGAMVGSALAVALVGRERLGLPVIASGVLFGGAVAAIGVVPGPIAAAILLALAGVGSGLAYIAGQTLIQRIAADDVLSRVFGVLEGLMMACTALGALAVPAFISLFGEHGAFVIAGISLPAAVAILGTSLLRADRAAVGHGRELRLLRGQPMFAALSGPVLERLAANVEWVERPGGSVIIRAGDRGDRYFVIAAGSVEVEVDGRVVRRQAAGEGFGEIALIKDVPRTATVRAVESVELAALDREPFLEALTGGTRSRSIAAGVVAERLKAGHAGADGGLS
jgi:MFS family permease